MKKQFLTVATVLAVALLAACGGGDGSTDTPTEPPIGIDKYVGKWSTCFATDTGFEQDKFSLTKVNDTKGAIFDGRSAYEYAGCTGTQTVLKASMGTLVLTGTTTIDGATVDTTLITESGFPPDRKQVFLIQGMNPATMTLGRTEGPLDADGYPATLERVSLTQEESL